MTRMVLIARRRSIAAIWDRSRDLEAVITSAPFRSRHHPPEELIEIIHSYLT